MTPAFLLIGNETLANDYIIELINKIGDEKEVFTYTEEDEPEIIFDKINETPLFGSGVVVIVKHPERMKETKKRSFITMFNAYINTPNGGNILIITTEKPITSLKKNKYVKVEEFKKLYGKKIVDYIKLSARKEGKSINDEAAILIKELNNDDLSLIKSALLSIIRYSGDNPKIGIKEVKEFLSRESNLTIFDFIESVFTKNTKKALLSLNDLRLNGESIIAINNMLYRTAKILWIFLTNKQHFSKLGISSYETQKLKYYSNYINLKFLSKILSEIKRIEVLSKSTGEFNTFIEMESFLVSNLE